MWVFNEPYVRFALMDYDPKKRIKYAHLTNNCLVKKFLKQQGNAKQNSAGKEKKNDDGSSGHFTSPEKSSPSKVGSPEKFNDQAVSSSDEDNADDDELVNIWSHQDFSDYLQQNFQEKYPDTEDIFYDVIFEQIKE